MKAEEVDKMTVQEACDYAINRLVAQGKRCTSDYTRAIKKLGINSSGLTQCAYGDDKGNHCAIGWLLDEDNPQLMGCGEVINGVDDHIREFIPELIKNNMFLFSTFQQFHDRRLRVARTQLLKDLKEHIDVDTNRNYKKWALMGDAE